MNTNTITRINALAAAIGLALSANVFSADTANQGVEYTIPEVRELSTTGSASLTLATPAAGSDFTAHQVMTGSNTDLSITSVVAAGKTNKITAHLNSAIGNEHVQLSIAVGSQDEVTLTGTTAQTAHTVLENIGNFVGAVTVTYYLTATYEAGAFTASRIVYFTIVDDA